MRKAAAPKHGAAALLFFKLGQNEALDLCVRGSAVLGTVGLVTLGGLAVELAADNGYRLVLIGILCAALGVRFRSARLSSWQLSNSISTCCIVRIIFSAAYSVNG